MCHWRGGAQLANGDRAPNQRETSEWNDVDPAVRDAASRVIPRRTRIPGVRAFCTRPAGASASSTGMPRCSSSLSILVVLPIRRLLELVADQRCQHGPTDRRELVRRTHQFDDSSVDVDECDVDRDARIAGFQLGPHRFEGLSGPSRVGERIDGHRRAGEGEELEHGAGLAAGESECATPSSANCPITLSRSASATQHARPGGRARCDRPGFSRRRRVGGRDRTRRGRGRIGRWSRRAWRRRTRRVRWSRRRSRRARTRRRRWPP